MSDWTPEIGLRAQYPAIPWDEPLLVNIGGKQVYVCRYCVALHGVKGIDLLNGTAGYSSSYEAIEHIADHAS